MGICAITAGEIRKHLPCSILSLGWPDYLHESVDLSGSDLIYVDLYPHHGGEHIVDLSLPQKLYDMGPFDLVLDCGTLEHVSDIAAGFVNVASAVRAGGRIIHHLPLNVINHGYWNICPMWYVDFYRQNGFEIERLEMNKEGSYHEGVPMEWPNSDAGTTDFTLPYAAMTLCVARRVEFKPIEIPRCQEKWKFR